VSPGRILRVLVAAGLTGYLLWRSDPSAVLQAAAHADLGWLAAAVLLVFVDRALMAERWIHLLCIIDPRARPRLGRLLEIFFVSTFVGTFLPASIGGDAVRAYSLSRENVSCADAVASVFMDRMLGVASLLLVGVGGLFLARDLASNRVILLSLALTLAVSVLTMLIIFSERVGIWCARLASAMPIVAVQRAGGGIIESVRRYAGHHLALLTVLASSVAVQILRILQAYCLGRAIAIEAGPSVYFAFIPLILLVMLLPVSINGLGTGQAAFVWFFARAGVSAAPAFALSLLFILALQLVGNLPGAFVYAFRPSPAAVRSGPGGVS
jgi:glycosyltransferase 2 family protein